MNKPHIQRIDGIWEVRRMPNDASKWDMVSRLNTIAYYFVLKLNGWVK